MEKVEIIRLSQEGGVFNFSYKDQIYKNLEISLIGEYQVYNATLALMTILVLKDKGLINIEEKQIREGLKNTKWPGRLEILKRNPTFLIDGAHNLQGGAKL